MIVVALATEVVKLAVSAPAPVAKVVPVVRDIHGEKFVDPYAWMRDRNDKDLMPLLKASNAHADAVMGPTKGLQGKLYSEFVARIKESDVSVPYKDRGYFYYSKTQKGKQYSLYCRRKGSMRAREEVLLDPNKMAKGSNYVDIGEFDVSPDARLLAYTVDTTGYRQYQGFVKDLRTGKVHPKSLGLCVDVVWAADNRTLFYTTENSAKRNYRAYRTALGSNPTLIYEEKDAMFDLGLSTSRDRRHALLMSYSKETTEGRLINLANPAKTPTVIAPRREGVEYYPEVQGNRLLIRTNDSAPEFRLVVAPLDSTSERSWQNVLAEQAGATLESVDAFEKFAILQIRKNAVAGLSVLDYRTGKLSSVRLPDPYYSVGLAENPDYKTDKVRLRYASYVTPTSTYDYDVAKGRLTLLKRQAVPGYDPAKYASEVRWVIARDGVKIPVAMFYRRGTKFPAPMLLDVYGAYGAPSDPYFSSTMLPLLDRGIVGATALVRGGGEMGEKWHDAGKMARKMTTFTDLIDVAKGLAQDRITSAKRLCLTGGSAGGLTLGATMNMAPEICRAALVYVPFVDVVNTMLDESIPLTTQEFIEWGNPKIEDEYRWIRAYSPYDNVGALDYPAMLVRTSLNDSQVPYWEPCKWVARLRALRTDSDPLLLKVDLSSGHGGSSGRYDALRDRAFDYAFVLAMIGETN